MVLTGYTHRIPAALPCEAIIAPEYADSGDPALLAAHCLELLLPDFGSTVREGDILVVAQALGGGPCAEVAVLALQAAGIAAIVCGSADESASALAQSYGLPVLCCPEAAQAIPGDVLLRVDLATGQLEERTSGARWRCPPINATILAAAQRAQLLARTRRVAEDEGFAE